MKKRKSKNDGLVKAKRYADLLLFQISSGNMGQSPEKEIKNEIATFGEKRGLLDSLIKIAILETKDVGDEDESGFELIRRKIDGSSKDKGGGGSRRAAKDSSIESDTGNSGGPDDFEESGFEEKDDRDQ